MKQLKERHNEYVMQYHDIHNSMGHLLSHVLDTEKIASDKFCFKVILIFTSNLKEITFSIYSLLRTTSSYGYKSIARNVIELKHQLKYLINHSQYCESFYLYFKILQPYQPFLNDDYDKYGYTDTEKETITKLIMDNSLKLYGNKFQNIDELVTYYQTLIGSNRNNGFKNWYGIGQNNISKIIYSQSPKDRKKYRDYSSEIHLSGNNVNIISVSPNQFSVQHDTSIDYEVLDDLYLILEECRLIAYDFIRKFINT